MFRSTEVVTNKTTATTATTAAANGTTTTTTTTAAAANTTNPTIPETDEELQKKRTALAGQWRTPPTPFFSSGRVPIVNATTSSISTIPLDLTTTPQYVGDGVQSMSLPTMGTSGLTVSLPTMEDGGVIMTSPPTTLPHSTEDYAKALQEAYRQGAEAAARAAAAAVQQQQQQQMVHVASCPDLVPLTMIPGTTADAIARIPLPLSQQSNHPMSMSAPASTTPTTTSTITTGGNSNSNNDTTFPLAASLDMNMTGPVSEQQQQQPMQVQVVHHHHHHHILPAPPTNDQSTTTTIAGSTSLLAAASTTNTSTTEPSAILTTTTKPSLVIVSSSTDTGPINPININNHSTPMVLSSHLLAPPPPPATTLHQPSTDLTGLSTITRVVVPTETKQQQQQQQQQRSVSLPDMSSYAAQQEDEKRQKRLARNRASARLRRLRKKNLVDAYEIEVGHLEKTMAQLQHHEWGCTNSSHTTGVQSATVLAEALSMDRGQQKLSVSERQKAATDILQQQLQFLQQLEDLMQEQYVLQQVAQLTLNGAAANSDDRLIEWKDLQDMLQLSPDQCQQIIDQSIGWDNEWQSLQTVKSSLIAMRDNDWLWNEGCATITDQFVAILHSNQISKLLLWADHNAETIEELDCVHAINIVPDTPIFQFGMDSNPNEYMDDERMAT